MFDWGQQMFFKTKYDSVFNCLSKFILPIYGEAFCEYG